MAKNSKDAYGAEGHSNLLTFDPDKLKLVTSKTHFLYDPRVDNDPLESLIASIEYKGVVEPLIVWKDPETGDVCVLDGRQRVKAAREANKRLRKRGEPIKLVKAIVERGDPKALFATMIVANEGRTDPTPTERAKLAQRLLEQGYTEDVIAVILHCSNSAVKNYLALLDCPADVRKAVESGKLPATRAYELSKLEPAEAKATLGKMLAAAEGSTGKRARAKKMRSVAPPKKSGNGHALRPRTEISELRKSLDSRDDDEGRNWLSCLDWVLGKSETHPSVET